MNTSHRRLRNIRKSAAENLVTDLPRDKNGRLFNPSIHAVLKNGKPRISSKGNLYLKSKK